jgi:hypothetical protein
MVCGFIGVSIARWIHFFSFHPLLHLRHDFFHGCLAPEAPMFRFYSLARIKTLCHVAEQESERCHGTDGTRGPANVSNKLPRGMDMTQERPEPRLSKAQQEALHRLFDALPDDFWQMYDQVQLLSTTLRAELAQKLESKLNDHLAASYRAAGQHVSNLERRRTASWINTFLGDLGLCLAVEGHPAILMAEKSRLRKPSRYSLLIAQGDSRFTRTPESSEIPTLQLMAAPPGIEETVREARQHLDSRGRAR